MLGALELSAVPLFFYTSTFQLLDKVVVTGVVPSPPRFLLSNLIAHRVQQSHCSSIFHRVLLTHALALSASQLVHKKKSTRIYTSMHSGGFELTKLTCTRLEDNLIRHRGDRSPYRGMAQEWHSDDFLNRLTSLVVQKTFWRQKVLLSIVAHAPTPVSPEKKGSRGTPLRVPFIRASSLPLSGHIPGIQLRPCQSPHRPACWIPLVDWRRQRGR